MLFGKYSRDKDSKKWPHLTCGRDIIGTVKTTTRPAQIGTGIMCLFRRCHLATCVFRLPSVAGPCSCQTHSRVLPYRLLVLNYLFKPPAQVAYCCNPATSSRCGEMVGCVWASHLKICIAVDTQSGGHWEAFVFCERRTNAFFS